MSDNTSATIEVLESTPSAPSTQDYTQPITLPFEVPSIGNLSSQEVQALRNKISAIARIERDKATKVLSNDPKLRSIWVSIAGMQKTNPKRIELMSALHADLLRYPEAFLANAYMMMLFTFDDRLRDLQLQRGPEVKPKRKKGGEVLPPSTSEKLPWEV